MIEIEAVKYAHGSMAEQVFAAGTRFPDAAAYEYFGSKRSFRAFEGDVRRTAAALCALGIKKGDRMMLAMPNVPQAIVVFYALNLIGAVACMTHPLSSAEEMDYYIESSKPRAFITLYQFYDKFRSVLEKHRIEATVLTGPGDMLALPLRLAMSVREKKPRSPRGAKKTVYSWGELQRLGLGEYEGHGGGDNDVAAVLYSGGTTGRTKGILLTNMNFNALAMLTARAGNCIVPHTKMLAVMPVFHGFGLGVCIHTALYAGVTCILVPRFTVESYAKLLRKQKPNYIAGVPTLYEALLRLPDTEKIDLSMLRGVFSGGDMLPPDLRRRVDEFLSSRGSPVGVREGYGLTECVTACCLTPSGGIAEKNNETAACIGRPFDDITFKIIEPDTQNELPLGETGEICLTGPTVMMGYDGNDEETEAALQIHSDGREWLHTGDLGSMDERGFVYFRGRRKRLIITSGYNVYPYEVERVLGAHEYVKLCAVVGVPDEYRMERVKAIVVLRDGAPPENEAIEALREHCKNALAPFNRPREYELRGELPTTLVGKVSYAELDAEKKE